MDKTTPLLAAGYPHVWTFTNNRFPEVAVWCWVTSTVVDLAIGQEGVPDGHSYPVLAFWDGDHWTNQQDIYEPAETFVAWISIGEEPPLPRSGSHMSRQTMLWAELLAELASHGENPVDIIAHTMTESDKYTSFDDNYGGNIPSFTVWTQKRVYFPCTYTGDKWVYSVARHPDGTPTQPVGGE